MTDLCNIYPNGLNEPIPDEDIDAMEDYYKKPIEKITEDEIEGFYDYQHDLAIDNMVDGYRELDEEE